MPDDNDFNGGSSFSHPPARFHEFIRPLNLESHINNAVPEPHGAGHKDLPVPKINDHRQVCYKELLRKKGVEIAGVLVSTLFLLFTLTVKSLKEIKARFIKIAGVLLILPLWYFALGFLILVFGRFIFVCIVGGAIFLLCHQMHHKVYIVLHNYQTALGTFLWGALMCYLGWLILPADSRIGAIPIVHPRQLVTTAFTLFTVWQGGELLFQTIRVLIYLKLFDKKMKDVFFRLFMLDALLGPPLTDEKRTELQNEANGRSKKSSRTTTVEYSTRKLLAHDEGRILLANIDDFIDLKLEWSQTDMLQQASWAFQRIVTNNGEHKYIDVSRFLTEEETKMIKEARLMPAGFGPERGEISQSAFLEWAVEAYRRQKSLVYAIIDTKRMLCYLQYTLITFTVVTVAVALHVQEKIMKCFASALILGYFSSHAAKIISSIFFVFVTHPFDAGDCCVIDGDQMIVEEINILQTVFLPFHRAKVYHQNSELLSRPISNYSQKHDMSEMIEFSIDVSTITDRVDQLKTKLEKHLRSKPEHWQAECNLLMLAVEGSNMKMTLTVQHNMNCHSIPDMAMRKSQLLTDLMRFCQELKIRNFV